MDPLSVLVTTAVLWHLLRVVVEDLTTGETASGHRQRLAGLAEAGYTPPSQGGPARQFLATAWRSAWLDALDRYQARRAGVDGEVAAWQRWRQRMADQATATARRVTDAWRTTPTSTGPAPATAADPGDPTAAGPTGPAGGNPSGPTAATDGVDGERDLGDVTGPGDGWPEPIRVQATVGSPTTPRQPGPASAVALAALAPVAVLAATDSATPAVVVADRPNEGKVSMSNAVVAAGGVTGVVSGAAAARAIARRVEEANAAYIAELARIRGAIAALTDQTVAVVQMSGHSRVVDRLLSAAESAAVAQRAASALGAEVGPWLDAVARAYDRLNS